MELTFEPEKHEYKLDGVSVPSVTQILVKSGIVDTIWYTENGCARGDAVHKAIHYHDQDDLEWDSLDEIVKPYVEAWIKFRTDVHFEIIKSEESVYDPIYRYAGTYDKIGFLGPKNIILDIKTGAPHQANALQLAAYAATFTNPLERYALHLKPDGTYKLIHYTDRSDIKTFLAALAVVNWKQTKGLL